MGKTRKSFWVAQLIRRMREEVRNYQRATQVLILVVGLTLVFLSAYSVGTMVANSNTTVVGLGEAGLDTLATPSPRSGQPAPLAVVPPDTVVAPLPPPVPAPETTATDVGTGTASYYGPGLQGNPTASGERFDMNKLTAAHRTLPMGSRVRVTNLRNGRSVVVRINDRGPFHGNRMIDLSKEAARRIGMLGAGKARVRLELLHES